MAIKEAVKEGHDKAMEVAEEAREKEWRQPSFSGQLFMGEFKPELLLPFPEQPAADKQEGDLFIESLADYLKVHLDPDKVDTTHEIPQEVINEFAKRGVFAMKVPKKYGGLGFSNTNYNRTVMKVASYCGATAVLISAHQSIGVPQPLHLFGTEEQKKKYFPKFREGAISAFALTEPEVGSDPAQMSAEAKLSEDGKYYILNGDKLWCTNGTKADIIIVVAKTAPKIVKGKEKTQISAFILDMNTPGVEIAHRCEFMGLGGIYNGLLRFKNVKIPVEDRLGDEGRGLAMALATINVGRLTLPAACTGAAKQCLSICRRWGKERVQWGIPVGLHEAGRAKISKIAATTFAMEAITWLTSQWADQGNVDIRIEAAMAKWFCTEELWKIVDLTMQLRGGRGYEKAQSLKARGEVPYPVERMMRDCRINTILEGTSEVMSLFLTREAVDPHFRRLSSLIKGKGSLFTILWDLLKAGCHYAWWVPSLWIKSWWIKNHKEAGPFDVYYRYIEKTSRRLALKLFWCMVRYQQKLEKKQLLLGRLMDIGTYLFVMSATCSYALHQAKKQGNKSAIDLAEYFCQTARRHIERKFKAIAFNDDSSTNKMAKRVIENEYRWLEEGIMWMGPDK